MSNLDKRVAAKAVGRIFLSLLSWIIPIVIAVMILAWVFINYPAELIYSLSGLGVVVVIVLSTYKIWINTFDKYYFKYDGQPVYVRDMDGRRVYRDERDDEYEKTKGNSTYAYPAYGSYTYHSESQRLYGWEHTPRS